MSTWFTLTEAAKSPSRNFDSYKVGEWFNYPHGIKVERLQLDPGRWNGSRQMKSLLNNRAILRN
jgi:hypothetical protein